VPCKRRWRVSAGKVLAIPGIGLMSFGAMLGALGLKLIVAVDDEALARVQSRLVPVAMVRAAATSIDPTPRQAQHDNGAIPWLDPAKGPRCGCRRPASSSSADFRPSGALQRRVSGNGCAGLLHTVPGRR
jgi:hypothetical protein